MTQDQLEALLREIAPNNDPFGRLVFSEDTDTIETTDPTSLSGEKVKRSVRVLRWVDPGTGMALVVHASPQADGTTTYTKISQGIDPKQQGAPAVTPAQQQAAAGAEERTPVPGKPGIYAVKIQKQQPDGSMLTETHYENEARQTVPTPTEPGKRSEQPETIGGKAYTKVTTVTTGPSGESITEQHYEDPQNPGVKIPTPLAAPTSLGVPAGSVTTKDAQGKTTKTTTYLQPDGTTKEVVDTATVATNTETEKDPQTGRTYEIVRNPDGSVKERREVPTTGPGAEATAQYTYPELQLAYGNISSELMAISKDIYSRVGTGPGKITKEEADRLFKPIYEQAQIRVSELNSIVSTQKSVWETQISTANQRLDAATRMASQAMGMASQAHLMAPGTGAVAGQMVWDMMHAQKDFAGGMGGLPDTGKLPGYLQAAMGMAPGAGGAPPGIGGAAAAPPPPGAPPAGAAPGLPPPGGPAGSPAGAAGLPPPLLGPPPAVTGPVGFPGGGPPTAGEPGGPPLAPGPVWDVGGADVGGAARPPGAPPAPLPGMGGPTPPMGQGQDLSSMPGVPPVPMPGQGQDLSTPQGYSGGGITINIGGQNQQPAASSLASADYLNPAANPQRPSLAETQRGLAGGLLDAGFDEDVLEQVWQRKTGQSLLNRGGMAAGRFG